MARLMGGERSEKKEGEKDRSREDILGSPDSSWRMS